MTDAASNPADISALSFEEALAQLERIVAELESGQAMTEMAQRLMAMSEAKERMAEAARHAWMLDRTLCAAHAECARLAEERDRALQRLMAGRD